MDLPNIQVADAGILSGANSVTANGTDGADNLNMIMIDTGLTIDAGAEDDAITGSAGRDSITGGAGDDTFVLFSTDSGLTSGTADTIEDFGANGAQIYWMRRQPVMLITSMS